MIINYEPLQVKNQEPPADEQQEMDKTRDFFLKLAGEDMEVDWKELKEILDYAMRTGKLLYTNEYTFLHLFNSIYLITYFLLVNFIA